VFFTSKANSDQRVLLSSKVADVTPGGELTGETVMRQ
jgi:hypothetical protein